MRSPEAERAAADLRRLLRYLSAGRARIATGEGTCDRATVPLAREGEAVRRFRADLFGAAVMRGLVVRKGGFAVLDPAGRAWLKRALCDDDPFAVQHGVRRKEERLFEGETETVTINLAELPLALVARLKRRDGSPFLESGLVAAGERLRADFTRGQLQPRLTASWERTVSDGVGHRAGSASDLSDAALGARIRVEHALAAVGPELSGVLVDICCFLKGLETVERERDWPVRSAKLMLRTALATLDRHYNPPPPPPRSRPRHWGAEDYRPQMRRE